MQNNFFFLALLYVVIFVSACDTSQRKIKIPSYFPQDNIPFFDSVREEEIALGSMLFFDKRLSMDSTVSCSSCHDPNKAFTDGKMVSDGLSGHKSFRNSSTLLNAGFNPTFMFDERAYNIDMVSLIPFFDTNEMGMNWHILDTLFRHDATLNNLSYQAYKQPCNITSISRSLGAFMKSLQANKSKFDVFTTTQNAKIFSYEEIKGKDLFFGKGKCNSCHTAPLFTNHKHYNIGIEKNGSKDLGKTIGTLRKEDMFKFKTPTLRNIEITEPYFHNGKAATLQNAVDFHLSEDRKTADFNPPTLNDTERQNLISFLKCLTDSNYVVIK
ncbi:MAG: cytochrome-c peroxidase [Chitinophagales bacterium]